MSRNGGISSKTSVPGPAPTVISRISEEPEAHDVNEQFLSLLDMDAAGKYKEMEVKCVEMERQRMEAEERLMEEMEKNNLYKNTNDQLKLGLKNIEDLQKENYELKLKVEEATKSEMDMFMMDSAPIVDSNKVDVEKDIEILALKNELEDKKLLVEKEAQLIKEVYYLKSIEKKLFEIEASFQREMEIFQRENLRISHHLSLLKEKK